VIFLWCVSVPLGYLVGLVWHCRPFWILFCLKIDNLLKVILCTFRLKSRKWMKKIAAV
jgi:Na+-driven multidrug efflux pump